MAMSWAENENGGFDLILKLDSGSSTIATVTQNDDGLWEGRFMSWTTDRPRINSKDAKLDTHALIIHMSDVIHYHMKLNRHLGYEKQSSGVVLEQSGSV